jgi:hypothetical protein
MFLWTRVNGISINNFNTRFHFAIGTKIFMVSSVVKNTSSSVKLFDAVNACPLLTVPVIVTLQAVLKGLEESNGVVINYNTTNNKYKSLKQIRAIVKGDQQ